MKKYIFGFLLLGSFSISAQSVVQGTIGATGTTIEDSGSGVQINFTLGQPFGEGAMQDGELTVIQGLQGASANIEESPQTPIGIEGFSILNADLAFNPETGEVVLRGSNLEKISGDIIISNLNGKVISQSRIAESQNVRLNISASGTNMYLITILTDDKKRLSKKIIF